MTATMDSSGESFTVTASSTYDFTATPLLCKIIFSINPTFGTATLIDPATGNEHGPATSISYTSRNFGAFQIKKKDNAPTSYGPTSSPIDLTTVFETSADSIDNTYVDFAEWLVLYSASFKATGLTYTAAYTIDTLT